MEQHLRELVVGEPLDAIERLWDLMWRGSLSFGRRGLVVHAISAVDLALWDLLGHETGRPVHELLGGPVRDRLDFYATTDDVEVARSRGFIGCKLPLAHGLAAGPEGLRRNVETFARAREAPRSGKWKMKRTVAVHRDVSAAINQHNPPTGERQ